MNGRGRLGSGLVRRRTLLGEPVETGDRARAETQLRQARDLDRLVVEESRDLTYVLETDGRIVYASSSHESKLGHGPEAMIGQRLESFVHSNDLPRLERAWEAALTGERGALASLRLRHGDGTWHILDGAANGVAVDGSGRVSFVVFTAHDVTEQREQERARERRERAEKDFVTNAAHDLRTPVASIIAAVEVLQQGAKLAPVTRDAFLDDVEQEAKRLDRLTQALLELARLQATGAPAQAERVELKPVLVDAARSLSVPDRVQIEVECEPGLAALADLPLLERAVVNLASNAAKHTPRGSITFAARAAGRDRVEIDVRDTGRGIPPDQLDRIFERFYRTGDRGTDGFGLGLSIVHEAVRVLGGTVAVDSTEGIGTTMRLVLPRWRGGSP
jgi:PAS domain S-box-containing protein